MSITCALVGFIIIIFAQAPEPRKPIKLGVCFTSAPRQLLVVVVVVVVIAVSTGDSVSRAIKQQKQLLLRSKAHLSAVRSASIGAQLLIKQVALLAYHLELSGTEHRSCVATVKLTGRYAQLPISASCLPAYLPTCLSVLDCRASGGGWRATERQRYRGPYVCWQQTILGGSR